MASKIFGHSGSLIYSFICRSIINHYGCYACNWNERFICVLSTFTELLFCENVLRQFLNMLNAYNIYDQRHRSITRVPIIIYYWNLFSSLVLKRTAVQVTTLHFVSGHFLASLLDMRSFIYALYSLYSYPWLLSLVWPSDLCFWLFGFKITSQVKMLILPFFLGFYRTMLFSANARYWDRMSSVRPSVCPSVCDVGDLWSHRLEILKTNCTDN